ncbi:hypothetical protein ACFFG5_30200 [Paraburkholderia humisilvae]
MNREPERLRHERTAHTNRIRALLVLHNLRVRYVGGRMWTHWWAQQREQLLPGLRAEIERASDRFTLVCQQIRRLEAQQNQQIRNGAHPGMRCWHGWLASGRAARGPWSGNYLAGATFATAGNWPAAWA